MGLSTDRKTGGKKSQNSCAVKTKVQEKPREEKEEEEVEEQEEKEDKEEEEEEEEEEDAFWMDCCSLASMPPAERKRVNKHFLRTGST